MPSRRNIVVFVVTLGLWSSVLCLPVKQESGGYHDNKTQSDNTSTTHSTHGKVNFEVATVDFANVAGPFTIMLWILIASFAKLGFHMSPKLSSLFPESSLVILLGIVIGGILRGADINVQIFSSRVFFLFMLPPIVLEAGYFLQDRAFFDNIGTILLYAVVGTLFNAFAVGLSLYGLTKNTVYLPFMEYLIFGALIAAVDPVAVLAVFEEVKVNVMLYILVFGESLLNDAVTVVLYHLFEKLALMEEVTYKEVLLGIANFLVVSLGGTLMGLLWGFGTAIATKYTDHVRVIEPIFVFVMSYLAYLSAEVFHLSGIMSIVTCAIIMKPYVERNISRKSHTTVKYFMKMLSSSSETLIFMFLGISLVTYNHHWNTGFVLWTLFLITVFRTIGVAMLTYLANRFGRLSKLSAVDQFIMSYGGIRGAVSFSLAILLPDEHFKLKDMIVTTTIVTAIFTIFFQGTTIKPLVKVLNVRLHKEEKPDMYAQLNDKLLDHLVAGMEEVMGHRGHTYYWEMVEHFHNRYLRKWLVRENESKINDEDILLAYRKLEYKDALTHLEREGSGSLLFASPSGHHLQALSHSAVANAEGDPNSESLLLRGGAFLRVPDLVVRDFKSGAEPSESIIISETPHNLSNLLSRSRKTYCHRKFQRNNIIDDFVDSSLTPSHLLPYRVQSLRFKAPPIPPEMKHKLHKHRRHHKKKGRHKKHGTENFPPKKKLSTIFEPEEGEAKAEERETELASRAPKQANKEDTDEGISFIASGVRWKIGRQLSADESETDKLVPEIVVEEANEEEEEESSSSSSDEESTGDELEKPDEPETEIRTDDGQGFEPPEEPKVTQLTEDASIVPRNTTEENLQSIPLVSFVVDIEDETPDAKREGNDDKL